MGVERTVQLTADTAIAWRTVAARSGLDLKVLMIDGLPAFPDEEPADGWTELRIGTPAGMVTLRRTSEGVSIIVWGNASPELMAARDALADALSATG